MKNRPLFTSFSPVLPYNYFARQPQPKPGLPIKAANRNAGREHPMPVENKHSGIVNNTTSSEGALRASPLATLNGRPLLSNQGIPINLDWIKDVRVNTSAVERRAQTHVARRTVKKDWQAAWLLRAITCMDLTTLSGDDTDERVRRLCAKGRQPVEHELVKQLGIEGLNIQVAAICVYHRFVETARRALEGSNVRVAAVSTGFPAGLSPLSERIAEIHRSVKAGAQEIDVVITRAHVFGGRWQELYDEIAAFKQACGAAHMKVILGTGDLLTLRNVARASFVAMMAGADFIKTSTGKEPVNATLPVGIVMTRAIREYAQETGMAVGFKAAGGIRTAKQSLEWLALMKEELGLPWMKAELFRFGASGLLNDIERQLEHHVTGRYSADYRHPIA
jgi:deoxyribose-phosphate aldolase